MVISSSQHGRGVRSANRIRDECSGKALTPAMSTGARHERRLSSIATGDGGRVLFLSRGRAHQPFAFMSDRVIQLIDALAPASGRRRRRGK